MRFVLWHLLAGILVILLSTFFIILNDRSDLSAESIPSNISGKGATHNETNPYCEGYDFPDYCFSLSDVEGMVNAYPKWNKILQPYSKIGIYTEDDQFTLRLTKGGRYRSFESGVKWSETDFVVYIEPALFKDIIKQAKLGCIKALQNDFESTTVSDDIRGAIRSKKEELDKEVSSQWKISPEFTIRC